MPKYTTAQASLKKDYEKRLADNQQIKESWQKKAFTWSIIRLIYFFAAGAAIVFIFAQNILAATLVGILALLIFAWLIRRHLKMQATASYHDALAQVNAAESNVFDFKFNDRPNGERFFKLDHLYAQDLDLFGDYSFFQYANRASTSLGEQVFADMLSEIPEKEDILRRQEAAKDLSQQLEWRQKFQALGVVIEDAEQDFKMLEEWRQSPNFLMDKWYVKVFLILAPIWFAVSTWWCFTVPNLFFLIVAWGLPLFILGRFVVRINEVHRQTSKVGTVLKQYAALIDHIEQGHFKAPFLQELQAGMTKEGKSASKAVRQLGYIIHQLDARNNAFVIILNVIGLWDMYWVRRLEFWKEEHREHLPDWFMRMGNFEAMLTLGTLTYNWLRMTLTCLLKRI